MAEAFWSGIAPPLAAGAVLSFALERLLRPDPRFSARPPAAIMVHMGTWLLAYCASLALVQRPWFAAALTLGDVLLIVLVSNAKSRSTREPFVFQDFDFITDALAHPRLYFPFLGVARAALGCAAIAAAIWGGLAFEASLLARAGAPAFWGGCAVLALLGAALVTAGILRGLPLTFEATDDIRRLGLIASLWGYARAERERPNLGESAFASAVPAPGVSRPHVVVVQSESFFDARRLYAGIGNDVLREFDAARESATRSGQLEVPAWGANTVRTEFAFLSGLRAAQLGVHRFNPYRRLDVGGIGTIAGFLKRAGYRTVCVHPYVASFYSRDRVFPAFGFDEFIDVRAFSGIADAGPFVGDLAVAEKIRSILEASAGPTLVFAITMENHGPLHLEQVVPGDVERLYAAPPPAGFEDLTVYLRHLCNADRMIGKLRECLTHPRTAGWLCWYGDHVPIMPTVYDATGFNDGRSDYFVVGPARSGERTTSVDLPVDRLARLLLRDAGLLGQLA